MRAEGTQGRKGDTVIRTVAAAVLVLAVGVLAPTAAGGKTEYTAACSATSHDVTLAWPGGTDVTGTTARLIWPDGSEEPVNLALPKQGGLHTYTWHNLGTETGPLLGVEVQFVRNNSFFPPSVGVFCSQ
jgi:hypothetical protein